MSIAAISGSNTAFSSALGGLRRAGDTAYSAATRIATNGPDAEAAVDLLRAETETAANAATLRTVDEMHKHLVDILA